MDLGICVRDVPVVEVARLGCFAEEHGFHSVFVPDVRGAATPGTALGGRDAFVTLGALFEKTSSLRGGVGVAAVIFHSPPALARLAGTLNEQSGGRFVLGVGISHREAAAPGAFPASPLGEMRRWVGDMRHYSAEGALAFGGGFPVLVGALGPKMLALGASEADGVVLNWLTPEHAATTVATVRQATPAGRSAEVVLYVRVSPPEAVRTDAVNYDRLANYHRHFEAQGLTDPDAIVAGTCLPPDDPALARERLAAYAEAGVDLVCLYPHGFDEAEREHVLARLVSGIT